jgi:hypothetical protein
MAIGRMKSSAKAKPPIGRRRIPPMRQAATTPMTPDINIAMAVTTVSRRSISQDVVGSATGIIGSAGKPDSNDTDDMFYL